MSNRVELDSVTKRYRRRGTSVLNRVSLTLDGGTVTSIIGGNGSGKSTLLRLIGGYAIPTSGRITGRPPRVGYVPERFVGPGNLTARKYLGHMGSLRGLTRGQVRRSSDSMIDLLNLQPGPDVRMSTLSKGNQQKIAIAQAFAEKPALLILDEPRTGLDPATSAVLSRLVESARDAGAIVIVSMHEMGELGDSDRAFTLQGGALAPYKRSVHHQHDSFWVRLISTPTSCPPDVLCGHLVGATDITIDYENFAFTINELGLDDVLRIILHNGWSVRGMGKMSDPKQQ